MSPSPPTVAPAALRWITRDSKKLNSLLWLRHARAAGIQAIVAPWNQRRTTANRLAVWATHVREAGLVAAIRVPVPLIAGLPLAELDAIGPLLVVAVPERADDLETWQQLRDVLSRTHTPKLRFSALGAPTCHLGPWQADVALAAVPWRAKPPTCGRCGAQAQCPGPLLQQSVAPLPEPVSNQFDLSECPPAAAFLTVQTEPPRYFCLHQPASPLIAEALARGQVYLDRSDKARLDDFAADLALLLPDCADRWNIAQIQPFAAEEALLLEHLRGLSGVVVDVGAGPIRYIQELARAQAKGGVRYVAVEPDLAALQRTVVALPAALCLQGTGEHLPLRDGSADAVLMLRSFNHLRDVPQALREVARVLKPGGVFLACDNVAFGLCRSTEQLARAHAIAVGETPFEHYRNADAPDAAAALAAAVPHGFHVEALHAVGPGTSNQWFLRATRREPTRNHAFTGSD